MADPCSSSAPGENAPLPQNDWEVLSMSMSASAFDSSSILCACDACTGRDSGNTVPHIAGLPSSVGVSPAGSRRQADEESEDKSHFEPGWRDDSSIRASGSEIPPAEFFSAGRSSDLGVGDDKSTAAVHTFDAEPFTEGWIPHVRTSANLGHPSYDDFRNYADSQRGLFREDYQEGTWSANEYTEPSVEAQEKMPMAGEDCISAAGNSGENMMSAPNPMDADKIPVKKVRKTPVNETWWKRQAALWQTQSRKSSAMWSIALAATAVGILIIGHRWHRERLQNQQLRLELCARDEKLNDLMYQVNRLKDAITGHRRVPIMRS